MTFPEFIVEALLEADMSYDRLNTLYNKLYNHADRITKQVKPCGIEGNKCRACGTSQGSYGATPQPGEMCCAGCTHHGEKGCKADRPLACKTWLCPTARYAHPDVAHKLDKVAHRAQDLGLWGARASKPEVMHRASRSRGLTPDDPGYTYTEESYAGFDADPLNSDQAIPADVVSIYRSLHQPWAQKFARAIRDRFGINIWVNGTVTTGWKIMVHRDDADRAFRMLQAVTPLPR